MKCCFVILLSHLFMHFSKSFMIHMKDTCCPCLVKIHVNKFPVASWPCSGLIPCHINILAEDQCQVCFHLTNPALLALFSLWSAACSSWCFWSSLQGLFFFFPSSFCILKYVMQLVHWQDLIMSKSLLWSVDFAASDVLETWQKGNRQVIYVN